MAKLTDEQLRRLVALIDAQAAVRGQLSATAVRAVQRAFAAVDDFWDTEQTRTAVADAVRVVQAQQRRMAQVTDAYLAQSTSLITGRRVGPVGAVDVSSLRRKLPQEVIEVLAHARTSETGQGPALTAQQQANIERARAAVAAQKPGDVYGRLADGFRWGLTGGGQSERQAREQLNTRAEIMADTDVMLADRAQVTKFMDTRKPGGARGYRRVLHPEVGSGAPPCGLCVVAADRVYSFEELMPIHARCRCTVVAVGADDDPGFTLNEKDLAAIYQKAGSTAAADLKRIRVEVTEHGEFGPWLINPTQRYRGPREYARTQTRDEELKTLDQLEDLQLEYEKLLARQAGGEDLGSTLRWHRSKIKELTARIPAA